MSNLTDLNLLVALNYCTDEILEWIKTHPDILFLLDSGAFTAWKKGREIQLNDYCAALDRLDPKPWKYFSLDVVGDARKTKENYVELLKRGYAPIPIFTRGQSLDDLEYYYSTTDLIGIGGLVQTKGNKGFVKGVMDRIGKRKVHWLGFTDQNFLTHYKPFSCDSSSWSGGLRYGNLDLYAGNGAWFRLGKDDFRTRPSTGVRKAFDDYEEDYNRFSKDYDWHNAGRSGAGKRLLSVMSYKSWARYSIELELKFNVKFFLSVGELGQLWMFSTYYDFWKKKLTPSTQ